MDEEHDWAAVAATTSTDEGASAAGLLSVVDDDATTVEGVAPWEPCPVVQSQQQHSCWLGPPSLVLLQRRMDDHFPRTAAAAFFDVVAVDETEDARDAAQQQRWGDSSHYCHYRWWRVGHEIEETLLGSSPLSVPSFSLSWDV